MKKGIKIYDHKKQLLFKHESGFNSFHYYKYKDNLVIESIIFPNFFRKFKKSSLADSSFQFFTQIKYKTINEEKVKISEFDIGKKYVRLHLYDDMGKKFFYQRYNTEKETDLIKNYFFVEDEFVEAESFLNEKGDTEKQVSFTISNKKTIEFLKKLKDGK
jgi:hypothetical protein